MYEGADNEMDRGPGIVSIATVLGSGYRYSWPLVLYAPCLFAPLGCAALFVVLLDWLFTTVFMCMLFFA